MLADLKIGLFGMVPCILIYLTLFQVSVGCFDGLHKEGKSAQFYVPLKEAEYVHAVYRND
jgi:hypothetical protein